MQNATLVLIAIIVLVLRAGTFRLLCPPPPLRQRTATNAHSNSSPTAAPAAAPSDHRHGSSNRMVSVVQWIVLFGFSQGLKVLARTLGNSPQTWFFVLGLCAFMQPSMLMHHTSTLWECAPKRNLPDPSAFPTQSIQNAMVYAIRVSLGFSCYQPTTGTSTNRKTAT